MRGNYSRRTSSCWTGAKSTDDAVDCAAKVDEEEGEDGSYEFLKMPFWND